MGKHRKIPLERKLNLLIIQLYYEIIFFSVMPGIEPESVDNQSVSSLPGPAPGPDITYSSRSISNVGIDSPVIEPMQQASFDAPKNNQPQRTSIILPQSSDSVSATEPCHVTMGTIAAKSDDSSSNVLNILSPTQQQVALGDSQISSVCMMCTSL